jgi:hypothetical protein
MTPVPDGLNLDFIRASSYHGTSTSTSGQIKVEVVATQKIAVEGRHVLLVSNLAPFSRKSFHPAKLQKNPCKTAFTLQNCSLLIFAWLFHV